LHAGATVDEVESVIHLVNPLLPHADWNEVKALWDAVRDVWSESR
jgi:hypothetical protein